MKCSKKLLFFLALMLVVFIGCTMNTKTIAPTPDKDLFGAQSAENIYQHGAKGDYLSGWHMREGFTPACSDCHESEAAVDDSETVINQKCAECHGTYEDLRTQAKAASDAISAHDGHLAEISCTACHAGHVQSFVYCNNCHIFPMKIAFARQKIPYVPEDLSLYLNTEPNRIEKTDIVVIGAGGSGMVAAMEAAKLGKNVILLEKMPIIGGSSLLSTGGINAAGSSIQKTHGINDSVEMFVKDTLYVGKGTNDKELVRVLAENSADAVEWFLEKGGQLTIDPQSIYGGTSAPRMLYTESGGIGRYMTRILAKELKESGVDVRVNSKVVRLNTDSSGRVTGVLVKGKNTGFYEVQAAATILATGSYGNNGALVAKFNPSFYGMVASTQPGAHGDGITLAQEAGAKVISLEKVQIHPNIAQGTSLMITMALRTSGGILVNKESLRFMNDNAPRNEIGVKILQQTGQSAFLIYDENIATKRQSVHNGYVRLGLVVEADTPEELAEKLGIPKAAFVETMKKFSAGVAAQQDEFGRKELPESLTGGKLYAIDVIPAIGGTLGGVVINTHTQVLDKNGNPIPSLFASGEVVGGWHGDDRYGGNAVAGNIVFGRIAAQNAAKLVK